jgi:hypothetical protein
MPEEVMPSWEVVRGGKWNVEQFKEESVHDSVLAVETGPKKLEFK